MAIVDIAAMKKKVSNAEHEEVPVHNAEIRISAVRHVVTWCVLARCKLYMASVQTTSKSVRFRVFYSMEVCERKR